jgi:hypothetical protein
VPALANNEPGFLKVQDTAVFLNIPKEKHMDANIALSRYTLGIFFKAQESKIANCVSASAAAPHIEASIQRNQ